MKSINSLLRGLLMLMLVTFPSLAHSIEMTGAGTARLEEATDTLIFGNRRVQIEIDRRTGYFRDLYCRITDQHHKETGRWGSWPFAMRLGDLHHPDLVRVDITHEARHPQTMTYSFEEQDDRGVLTMIYENMVTTAGNPTGVRLTVWITLKNEADYYLIRAKIENNGHHQITNLMAGGYDIHAGGEPEDETLVVPAWSYGDTWPNPSKAFKRTETYGYPIFGSKGGLDAGWMDISNSKGGIGTGYLNRSGTTLYFGIYGAGRGINVNWNLFSVSNGMATAIWGAQGGIHPLQPGEIFTTDDWILALHAGDWHRMAYIYRKEYERAFEGDYLTWEETTPLAKQFDVMTSFTVRDVRADPKIERTFADVVPFVEDFAEKTGVNPENLGIYVRGHTSHWPLYMPDLFPCAEEAGGNEGCRRMIEDLKGLGMEGVFLYNHFFFDHPKADDYVSEADSGLDHLNSMWEEIGNVACVGNPEWLKLWKEKYIPGYNEVGCRGVWIDQGPVQYIVCRGKSGAADTAGYLSAHVNGILEIIQAFRDGLHDPEPTFWMEVGSDIQGRTTDIWCCPPYSYGGGVRKREVVRYTIPYRICLYQLKGGYDPETESVESDVNDALVNGFVLSVKSELLQKSKDLVPSLEQFLRIRRELREANAPGFPYGFRDQVGIAVDSPDLVARSYRSDEGITVVYAATDDVEAAIHVNPADLGFDGEEKSIGVSLKKHEAGYRIIQP